MPAQGWEWSEPQDVQPYTWLHTVHQVGPVARLLQNVRVWCSGASGGLVGGKLGGGGEGGGGEGGGGEGSGGGLGGGDGGDCGIGGR